jgi:hypothetical protein
VNTPAKRSNPRRPTRLQARDKAVENWLRQEVAPAYDAMKADPSRGRSFADVRTSLAAEH